MWTQRPPLNRRNANNINPTATYISLVQLAGKGLKVTANYTFRKSSDDASDSTPDKGAVPANAPAGQPSFGGGRRVDREVSRFDIKHSLNSTFLYGRCAVDGGWTVTSVGRIISGTPFLQAVLVNRT